jgi:Reverse transcriptase (RNA-dependent DNA polymerase)/Endonuclease-reverse transcriptase
MISQFKIGLFNVAGLADKADYVSRLIATNRIDILCLTETWETPLAAPIFGQHSLLSLPKPKGDSRRGVAGLKIIARNPVLASITRIIETDEINYYYAIVMVGPILLALCYFPPNSAHDNPCYEFIQKIAREYGDAPNVVLLGDFNGRSTAVGDTLTNTRGRRMLELLDDSPLQYCFPVDGRFSTATPNGQGRPDHVFTNAVGYMEDLRILETASSPSDHCPITFSIAIDPIDHPIEFKRPRIDKLRVPDCRLVLGDVYADTQWPLIEYLGALGYEWGMRTQAGETITIMERSQRITVAYDKITHWLISHMTDLVGVKHVKLKPKRNIWTQEVIIALQELTQAQNEMRAARSPTEAMVARREEAKAAFRIALHKRQQEDFYEFADSLAGPQRQVFSKVIGCIKGRATRSGCKLDPSDMANHRIFFSQSFGLRPTGDASQISEEVLSATDWKGGNYLSSTPHNYRAGEVRALIKWMANGKAPGMDSIYTEMLKAVSSTYDYNDPQTEDDPVANVLSIFFSLVRKYKEIPLAWKQARIIPVWKNKGTATDVQYYRPIALTSHIRRLYEKLILKAIKPIVDPHLLKHQGGFRDNRGTLHQILCLHELCVANPEAYKAFLDIKAAYDTVDRRILWSKLHSDFQMPHDLIMTLRGMFDDNRAILTVKGVDSEPILIQRGLLQGSTLSPILFNCYINGLLKVIQDERTYCRVYDFGISQLFFADDAALITKTPQQMHNLLQVAETWSLAAGIEFAPTKCEVMALDRTQTFSMYGQAMPHTDRFRYLGMYFNNHGVDFDYSFQQRVAKTRKLVDFFRSKGFNGNGWRPDSNIALYRAFIRPSMEYGISLRVLPKHIIKTLENLQNYAFRAMFSIACTTSKEALRIVTGLPSMEVRNITQNATFLASIATSEDGTIIANRLYEKATHRHKIESPDNADYLFGLATKNPLWSELKKKVFISRTREQYFSQETSYLMAKITNDHFNRVLIRRYNNSSIYKRNRRVGWNVANSLLDPLPTGDDDPWDYTVDFLKPGKGLPFFPLRMEFIPNRNEQHSMISWILGRLCIHQSCLRCQATLTREHGIDCSGARELLEQDFPDLVAMHNTTQTGNLINFILRKLKFDYRSILQSRICRRDRNPQPRTLNAHRAARGLELRTQLDILYEAVRRIKIHCLGWRVDDSTGRLVAPDNP